MEEEWRRIKLITGLVMTFGAPLLLNTGKTPTGLSLLMLWSVLLGLAGLYLVSITYSAYLAAGCLFLCWGIRNVIMVPYPPLVLVNYLAIFCGFLLIFVSLLLGSGGDICLIGYRR